MDVSDTPRHQTSRSATTNRHIPAEILEEILLLLRFSSVSKSWYSMIRFLKKYRGDERIIMENTFYFGNYLSCPLFALFSNNPIEIEEATSNHVFPLYPSEGEKLLRIMAACDGLWCVENKKYKSLFLWNPSIRTYHKLPDDPCQIRSSYFHYGLGYDSVGDDYKLLKICNSKDKVMLYSLRSNSWREIQSFPMTIKKSVWSWFVSGALHWLCKPAMSDCYAIVSFDLSTEEYSEVAAPPEFYSVERMDCWVFLTSSNDTQRNK